jgi:hypothetical protein
MKDNKSSLGISAADANFDSTLAAINVMLKKNSLDVIAYTDTVIQDTAFISVSLINKAGHKFPTGYPARRAVLQLLAIKANGDTLFASGLFDSNYELKSLDPVFEQHYDVITDTGEVQVYEMVMADVNGDKTTLLERSASHLKDNRIPPAGFTTLHNAYDTCHIVGDAQTDADFNRNGAIEGTGRDIVHYHIPLQNYHGFLTIYASVYYQSVPPGWLTEMSAWSSAEIDSFLQMYASADKSPVFVAGDTIQNILISTGIITTAASDGITLIPNPTSTGQTTLTAKGHLIRSVTIYTAGGKVLKSFFVSGNLNTFEIFLPDHAGVYFIKIETTKGNFLKKVLRI